MIVVLDEALFSVQDTDDFSLAEILGGNPGRYKVWTRPAYRPNAETAVHRWLERQSMKIRERARLVLEHGLKEPEYRLDDGGREPRVIIEPSIAPQWPKRFDREPAKLPLTEALDLLRQPLRLLLENGRNDWGFLSKIVPTEWQARWTRAVDRRWLEPENGGGLDEMLNIVQQKLADDDIRRLRTWAMFDCDGRSAGDESAKAKRTREACEYWGIAHHKLQRRAIENYIPNEVLFDWVRRRPKKTDRDRKYACARAYEAMSEPQRYYFNLKEGFKGDEESNQGISEIYDDPPVDLTGPLRGGFHKEIAQEIWGDNPYDGKSYGIREEALEKNGFGPERAQIFQSIFSRL